MKNQNENMLNIEVDLMEGRYGAHRDANEGNIILIRNVDYDGYFKDNFSPSIIRKRKHDIWLEHPDLTREQLGQIDTTLYKLLTRFDSKNGTDYTEKYLKILLQEIERKPAETKRQYKKRCRQERAGLLREAGMDIYYNTGLFNNSDELKLIDVIRGRRIARAQAKMLGVEANLGLISKTKRKPRKEAVPKKEPAVNRGAAKEEKAEEKEVFAEPRVSYTRKVKNKEDSIRNKMYRFGLRARKKVIAGVISGAAIAGAFLAVNNISPIKDAWNQLTKIESAKEDTTAGNEQGYDIDKNTIRASSDMLKKKKTDDAATKSEKAAAKKADDAAKKAEKAAAEKSDDAAKQEEQTQTAEEQAQQERIDYLSSVKVGVKMDIPQGRFFETSSGGGNYGEFADHAGDKILSLISAKIGGEYVIISDDQTNLYELKQQYPDAIYAYHFADENGNPLGWMTEQSFSEKVQPEMMQEENER